MAAVWLTPAIVPSILVVIITLAYFGSFLNPTSHLRGLPVELVDQDRGATFEGQRVLLGEQAAAALTNAPAVNRRLSLRVTSLRGAERAMDQGKAYGAIVIPPTFSASVLSVFGGAVPAGAPAKASVEFLSNLRLGSLGVSLATGVVTPAVAKISAALGRQLSSLPAASTITNGVLLAQLANPVGLDLSAYRPLPSHTALGLSVFYLALLTMMAGFLGATVVNTSIDAGLGFAVTEIGVHWRQRRPLLISRWHTLLTKWVVIAAVAPLLTALLLLVAAGALQMYAPHVVYLWLFMSVAAVMIGVGTLTLFAALGSVGQLVALVIFIYLGLASSGGTVPLQAVPGFYQVIAHVEPLRQILGGVRAIVFFDAQASAGLAESWLIVACELMFWLVVGLLVTTIYDRKGLYRMQPELMDYVNRSAEAYRGRDRAAGAG